MKLHICNHIEEDYSGSVKCITDSPDPEHWVTWQVTTWWRPKAMASTSTSILPEVKWGKKCLLSTQEKLPFAEQQWWCPRQGAMVRGLHWDPGRSHSHQCAAAAAGRSPHPALLHSRTLCCPPGRLSALFFTIGHIFRWKLTVSEGLLLPAMRTQALQFSAAVYAWLTRVRQQTRRMMVTSHSELQH